MLLKLSFKGFRRYKKRLKSLTVALSLVYIITFFFNNLFFSLNRNLREYWVGNYIGANLITDNKEDSFDLVKAVKLENYLDYNEFSSKNRKLESITSPRVRASVLLEGDNLDEVVARPVIMTGLDYSKERELNDFITIQSGRIFTPGSKEVILPDSVASALGADIGDTIYAFATTVDSYRNAEALEVVGFYKTVTAAGFAFGNFYSFMDLGVLQDLIQTDKVSEIALFKGAATRLNGEYIVRDSIKAISISRTIKIAYDVMFYIIIALLTFFSIGVVLQNVTMVNEERKGEIAIYLTYGAKPIWIKTLMIIELIIYATFCSLVGGIISVGFIHCLNTLGIYPVDIFSEILLGGRELVLSKSPGIFIKTWLTLSVLVIVGSYLPIERNLKSMSIVGLFKKE